MKFFSRLFCALAVVAFVFVGPTSAVADLLTNGGASATATTGDVENSVVKIFSTMRYPELSRPWTKGSATEVTGSGVVIKGRRILTNAHVVGYASQIQVQANLAGDKDSATVEFIAPGIDLAVLKLDDNSFFDTHPPLDMTQTLPEIKDSVMAYGYPEGGNSLSITKGIVSRIEFTSYNYSVGGLRIQIDAAINPGNSGGPAVVGDKMIGLAFSRLDSANNIGYIIPCEEINLFLQDIADGHYDGKPAMYDELQTLENSALRPFLKIGSSVHGMIVNHPASDAPDYPLKEWDVITKIGDTPVDDQGMIKLTDDINVQFPYLVQKIAKDGKVPLTVVRAGKEIPIQLPVSNKRPQVIRDLENDYPSYFIYGPIVFSEATKNFVRALTDGEYSERGIRLLLYLGSPLLDRLDDKPAFEGEQLVVVSSPFFPHRLAEGYSQPYFQVVKSVNGVPIKNLVHLVQVLHDLKDDYVTINFDSRIGETLVFPRKEMIEATDDILTDNGIRSQGSPDTMAVWNAKAVP
ncbi:MAG: trypsin-like peptidase domain-containing protein [Verrucomicrobiota bacterium]